MHDDTNINLFGFFPKCTHWKHYHHFTQPYSLLLMDPCQHSKVGDMDEANAIDLLLVRAAKKRLLKQLGKASEIVKELSCLPLAIVQAGAYISKFNCLHRYLSIYQQNRAKITPRASWTVP
ncbi:hypothetical protein B0H14DRAFT_760446 [Mycena olivaceomarginata]|nr:hypothetical protein B0H14DRAFT_760446 [Mycena olivaceomarginata]